MGSGRPALVWLDTLPSLDRPFGLDDFAPLARAHGVIASVLVQVLPDAAETEEFLAVATSGTLVASVVGWADLTAPDVAEQIARLRELPGGDRLAGLRHLVPRPVRAVGQPGGRARGLPNVAGKLSGLVTEAGPHWSAAQIGPYASHLSAPAPLTRYQGGSGF